MRWLLGDLSLAFCLATAAILLLTRSHAPASALPGGDTGRGRVAIVEFGCGGCHTIPGIPGADGKVVPPLAALGNRSIIAGEIPNTPENLIRWIRSPQAIEPGTHMPNMGVSQAAPHRLVRRLKVGADWKA